MNKMRSKIKIHYFIIFLSIFALAFIFSTLMAPDDCNQEISIDEGDSEQGLTNPLKISGYYSEPFIHIDGNWSDANGKGWFKGEGSWDKPYVIENVTINAASSPTQHGIWIENSKNDYFIIKNCTIMNSISSGGYYAIYIDGSHNGTLIGNNLTDNYEDIRLNLAENITVIENNMKTEVPKGIGIVLQNSDKNFILNNFVKNKIRYSLYLQSFSDENRIKGNSFIESVYSSSGSGIRIEQSSKNNISYNTLSNNNNGIKIIGASDDNIIHSNDITQNLEYGILITNSSGDCHDNNLYNNTFNNPDIGALNAYDNGTNTKWNLGTLGNRWHDYIGKDGNDDGIGDNPYYIFGAGNGVDKYPIFSDGEEDDDDDDDDDKKKKDTLIPGYDLNLIVITCFTLTIISLIKYRKRLNL